MAWRARQGRLDDKLRLAELDQRASDSHCDRLCRVELVGFVRWLAYRELGMVVLGEREGPPYQCCGRRYSFCFWRSRSVLQCGLLSELSILPTNLPATALACLRSHPATLHFTDTFQRTTKLTILLRWLRLAHSLDLQLRLRLRPLQLEDPNDRRTRSLRRLGPRRQRQQHRQRTLRRRRRRLARRQRRRSLRRCRKRLGTLGLPDLWRLDLRPMDIVVGRQRVPSQHLERLDGCFVGHQRALDYLVGLPGFHYRFVRLHHHGDNWLEHRRSDFDQLLHQGRGGQPDCGC